MYSLSFTKKIDAFAGYLFMVSELQRYGSVSSFRSFVVFLLTMG
jgi:hypothetical protein